MIKNNVLANRLNAVKNGTPIPQILSKNINNVKTSEKNNKIKINYNLISFSLIRLLCYGFSVNAIFNYSWSIPIILMVGFSIESIFARFTDIFKKT